jgi:hypothetical protein
MIFTQGGNTGGWAFYLSDGKLAAAHNYIDVKRFIVKSDRAVPAGKHELKMTFNYEGGKEIGKSGTITLSVDGESVGSIRPRRSNIRCRRIRISVETPVRRLSTITKSPSCSKGGSMKSWSSLRTKVLEILISADGKLRRSERTLRAGEVVGIRDGVSVDVALARYCTWPALLPRCREPFPSNSSNFPASTGGSVRKVAFSGISSTSSESIGKPSTKCDARPSSFATASSLAWAADFPSMMTAEPPRNESHHKIISPPPSVQKRREVSCRGSRGLRWEIRLADFGRRAIVSVALSQPKQALPVPLFIVEVSH